MIGIVWPALHLIPGEESDVFSDSIVIEQLPLWQRWSTAGGFAVTRNYSVLTIWILNSSLPYLQWRHKEKIKRNMAEFIMDWNWLLLYWSHFIEQAGMWGLLGVLGLRSPFFPPMIQLEELTTMGRYNCCGITSSKLRIIFLQLLI